MDLLQKAENHQVELYPTAVRDLVKTENVQIPENALIHIPVSLDRATAIKPHFYKNDDEQHDLEKDRALEAKFEKTSRGTIKFF